MTFEKPQDAYKAIDSSSGDPNLAEYDVSFGGRRAFCRTEYADLGKLRHIHNPHQHPVLIHPFCCVKLSNVTPFPKNVSHFETKSSRNGSWLKIVRE